MIDNTTALEYRIEEWEPEDATLVRVIDTDLNTVERIIRTREGYSLFRYFEQAGGNIAVSIDLQYVRPDLMIQHLAERL